MCIIVKTRCFHSLPLTHNQNFKIKINIIQKIHYTILQKHLLRKIRYEIYQGFMVGSLKSKKFSQQLFC